MAPIDNAIAAIESPEAGGRLSYTKAADHFGIDRSTLAQRHQGRQAPWDTQIANGRLLGPQQEDELATYIEDLTKDGLPPTRSMIRNFALEIVSRVNPTTGSPLRP
jgi:hypothetical protein